MLAGLFNSFMDANALGVAQLVGLGIAYAFVIGGFIYDLVKIRPLRNFYKAQVAGMTDRKVLEVLEEEAERLGREEGQGVQEGSCGRRRRDRFRGARGEARPQEESPFAPLDSR